ncbi:hypothetical protein N4Q63_08295 [Leclercia adecarboxylata]|uniref:Gp38 n=1 Tax=Leclercia adecarboxylata TaxID=83655 RepID=A0A9X3YA35_9ENTR|nr:hypothetical protein [Leclercia adecarboxylata]MBD1404267.1 hypothetical protein [Leclercia adecarboxylata]MDC6621896.1 hypothetical protein [Leclercia adecarboxylata]MDC6632968.1 hypothetical protein [Leclercia adecarboxylata]MDC6638264.1 hypothetical protein [Leclercia adecarboxylata]MDC6649007.1 hypothetical protein [Leclercia adecarboxylata]
MSKEKNGGPAFPVAGSEHNYPIEGMTLRDYFAAKAMQALVTSGLNTGAWDDYDDLAKSAWSIADAMLRAREAS